jgi:hypothetical protein
MRNCIFCIHLDSEFEEPGGGCDTCGYGAGRGFVMTCAQHHFDQSPRDTGDLRLLLATANTCPDYNGGDYVPVNKT